MAVYLGNQLMGEYLGTTPTNVVPMTEFDLIQSGLVFDFKATDYNSGSLIWLSNVGNFTASVTGSVGGPLNYIDGVKVGFDGNQWLQFDNATTASISSSQWQVYALVEFTGQQTASAAFAPELFSKGEGLSPAWSYAYKGGGTNPGWGFVDGGYSNYLGLITDNLNAFMTGSRQLFALTMLTGSVQPPFTGSFSINQYPNYVGNTLLNDTPSLITSFSGSVSAPLLFGKSVNNTTTNLSGSVVRLFAYNRILSSTERQYNWQVANLYP